MQIFLGILLVFLGLGILLLLRSRYECEQLVLTEDTVFISHLPSSFVGKKIVFLSDLHDHVFGEDNKNLIEKMEEAMPDYLFIGGDMMVTKTWKAKDFRPLKALLVWCKEKKIPVFYGEGNHEARMRAETKVYPGWWQEFQALLKTFQVTYLVDQTISIKGQDGDIFVSSLFIDEKYYEKGSTKKLPEDYLETHLGPCEKHPCILMAHSPLYMKEYFHWGADLVLCGHFHGGTIRIPGLGGVMSPQFHFFHPHCRGMFVEGEKSCIVSGGLGTHSIDLRINNLPEFIVITLKRFEEES